MTITEKDWNNYIKKLSRLTGIAGDLMRDFIGRNGVSDRDALIKYASGLVLKYGEATSELACLMYDAIAEAQKASVPLAVPADVATVGEVAKAVNGTLKQSPSGQLVDSAVQRLVKQAGADTTLQNAQRDGAEHAWIPSGDTCAFCITLASRGWERTSKKALKKGHAEHIHSHCDCQYAIRFNKNLNVAGYNPDEYLKIYNSHDGDINAIRRDFYKQSKEES